MNKIVKYLLGGIVFLLCVFVGYYITKLVGKSSETKEIGTEMLENQSFEEQPSFPASSEATKEVGVDNKDNQELSEPLQIALTEVQRNGDYYTLHVTCVNIPVNVILGYEIPVLKQKNTDGYFTRIPGCKSGSYKVVVTNSSTGVVLASKVVTGFKIIEEKPKELMTSSEFQSLLLNQNDNSLLGGKHPKVARSVALSFEGLHDGDRKPSDILAVREKIAYGIWSTAKVLHVGYDENGKINSARIQPIYNNENE